MARVMVIAGGDWQIDLIKKLKELGHYVICSNLYEDSPAFQYADMGVVANVLDKEKNLEIAKQYRPDAVISDQSDIAVPTVAYVNECLGLQGIGVEKAALFTDKSLQREFCRKHGIRIPDYKICYTSEDAIGMLEKYQKIIIKPVDSQSSRGVYTITSKEELEDKYRDSIAWSNRIKAFLAEECIEGAEFTIDGLVVHGRHFPLCISVKEMYTMNPNISKMQSYSYKSSEYDYDMLREVNRNLYEMAGLPMGLTHAEYKFCNGEFYLIEAGARGGGSNLSSRIVPFMSGIDNYLYLIKEALGEEIDVNALASHNFSENKFVIMRFFDFGAGEVECVEGMELLETSSFMLDYQLKVQKGDVLEEPRYGRLRPGHFILGGDDKKGVESEAAKILSGVRVVFKNTEEILV